MNAPCRSTHTPGPAAHAARPRTSTWSIRRSRFVQGTTTIAWLCLISAAASPVRAQPTAPPSDLKLAFIGDQGINGNARAVLELIRDEGADAVVHQGDFDYDDDPQAWDRMISDTLGADFPYFASVGNHDKNKFYGTDGYQDVLQARMGRAGLSWRGDLGAQSALRYHGVEIVLTAPGIFGKGDDGHAGYIADTLAGSDAVWRVSSWHKNMREMQVGGKSDETGWGVYEASRRGGAIIVIDHP